jgi:hypothetical protein
MAPAAWTYISVGTIFSIPRAPVANRAAAAEDFPRPGVKQVCAGYGVNGFTLDGQWRPAHPPRHEDSHRDQGIRHQRLQPALLGSAGPALCA